MHDIERTHTSDTTMADAFARAGFDTDTVIETVDGGDDDGPRAQSQTAIACEQAALFGATPERDEFDTRDVWDRDDATDAVSEAFRIMAEGVAPDGFQLADERESLLWGFVQLPRRPGGAASTAPPIGCCPEMRDLERAQDGTEVKARELELITDRARNFGDRRDAFETMRDLAADAYRIETGEVWRPRHGSHVSQTGHLTSAAIDARDFQRARKDPRDQGAPARGNPHRHRGWEERRRPRRRHRPASTRPARSTPT